jgi:hypothetical protein
VDDHKIIERITQLVAEEQRLTESETRDAARLEEVEVLLDQCWDLLRQRRAREEFGMDPDAAQARDPDVVERYIQ